MPRGSNVAGERSSWLARRSGCLRNDHTATVPRDNDEQLRAAIADNDVQQVIYVTTKIWSPRGTPQEATMVFDPGAAMTLISPDFTDALGYGAHLGDRRFDYEVRSARGEIHTRPASLDA